MCQQRLGTAGLLLDPMMAALCQRAVAEEMEMALPPLPRRPG
jgi:hypothetical protein